MFPQARRPAGSPAGSEYTSATASESTLELDPPRQDLAADHVDHILIPPIGREPQSWDPPAGFGVTRRERAAAGQTYFSAVPTRLDGLRLDLPSSLVADAEEAAAEISRFDAETEHGIGALTAVLLRSESASSSQIEQISASARAIAEAELTGSGTTNAVVVADNMRAMSRAVAVADALTAGRIADMQRLLLERHSPNLVGWRSEPVWIGGAGSTPVTADYVGPDHRRIQAAIDDLVRFAGRDDLPVLPHIAITHAQFETIHPFPDGNGRTGRAIVQLMLRNKQLARRTTVPISGGLLVDKDRYFEALTTYRSGDAAPIVDQFNRAALRAVADGRVLIAGLSELQASWREAVQVRSDSTTWKIIDLLPTHPVVDAEMVAAKTGIRANNVRRAIAPLEAAGIVVGKQHYKSHKFLYRAPQVLKLLDDYAAQVGRRQR